MWFYNFYHNCNNFSQFICFLPEGKTCCPNLQLHWGMLISSFSRSKPPFSHSRIFCSAVIPGSALTIPWEFPSLPWAVFILTHCPVGVQHSSQQLPDNCAILKTFNIYKYISFYLKFCQDREFQLETYFPLRILKAHCLLASGVIAKSEAFCFSILGLSAFFLTSLVAQV